ncbi:MAG: nicotinate phosphoribosyltransferase [Bryobacterales bacterium]|nr:nicotinate phosphoribosyltransferase [Bryobacterales bacterium]
MLGLLTDLYELTMAAGYVQAGKATEIATFELFIRHLPQRRNFAIAAGLEQAVEYLLRLRFSAEEIAYLRSLPQFARAPERFFETLAGLRFSGDLWAVREGTPVFPGEPVLTVRAPLIEAQIVETYLLATISYQTMVATKAARIVETAGGRAVIEFGTRRAHSPQAGVLAARAAYIGGCIGTSNTLAGMKFGIPVYGTAAHSWVQSFPDELEAFRQLQMLLGPATIYLIDTYDTIEGARKAASLGRPLWGVRLDSGDLLALSHRVRAILDEAGLHEAKIMATGDLNEYKIRELVRAGAPIDAFGVGTELATSADAPTLGAVYKLVELETDGLRRYTAKLSEEKATMPGAKQVYRFEDHDLVSCAGETPPCGGEALLKPIIRNGSLVAELPGAAAARSHAAHSLARLPAGVRRLENAEPYRVEYSPTLLALAEKLRKHPAAGAAIVQAASKSQEDP